jgi:arsenate reductase
MAEGWLRQYGGTSIEVKSAGVEVHGVNPLAIKVMAEAGVDISGHTSNNVNQYLDQSFDYVITVCDNARERCPFFPTRALKIHHNFQDPAKVKGSEEEKLNAFRSIRDQIRDFCRDFIEKELDIHVRS